MRSEAGKEEQAVNVYRLQADTPCRLGGGEVGSSGPNNPPVHGTFKPRPLLPAGREDVGFKSYLSDRRTPVQQFSQ